MNIDYKPRIADKLLEEELTAMGAVLIEGPKACGKTTTAEQQAQSILYMDDPVQMDQNLQLAETNIKLLLQGASPRLIDEWQIAPQLWDAIRFEVDHRGEDGLFMLTGSAVPANDEKIHHSGAGRFGWLTMRPMTLWESQESSGEVSLGDDLANKIDTTKMKQPAFKMILTAVGKYAYRRKDGILVVPIGCLKD